jgi:serine/threonine protein kinase
MAPEVIHSLCVCTNYTGTIYTEKADIYSAALIVWYLLTGMQPKANVERNPLERPDISAANRRWPEVSALLQRMWAPDPADRPPAASCVESLGRLTPAPPTCGRGACRVQ